MEAQEEFMKWLNGLPKDHAARWNVSIAREAFFAGASSQHVQADNPSVCPDCKGENYHHSTECYLGVAPTA